MIRRIDEISVRLEFTDKRFEDFPPGSKPKTHRCDVACLCCNCSCKSKVCLAPIEIA